MLRVLWHCDTGFHAHRASTLPTNRGPQFLSEDFPPWRVLGHLWEQGILSTDHQEKVIPCLKNTDINSSSMLGCCLALSSPPSWRGPWFLCSCFSLAPTCCWAHNTQALWSPWHLSFWGGGWISYHVQPPYCVVCSMGIYWSLPNYETFSEQ